jgi:2',3'-cyclic-nucleotide 2'-phosphodiesterase/3'-nucleotidase
VTITIMGTSDIHSNAVNWDYYKDAEYSDSAGNVVGLARVSSLVKQIRADRGRGRTLLFDHSGHPAGVLLRHGGADHDDR